MELWSLIYLFAKRFVISAALYVLFLHFRLTEMAFGWSYGKGYYDRFLKKFTFNSIGLCYNNFLSDSLPVDHFDVAVKYIATEDKITLCKEDK